MSKESNKKTYIVKKSKTEIVQEYDILTCSREIKEMYNENYCNNEGEKVGSIRDELVDYVNEKLKDGWRCKGGFVVLNYNEYIYNSCKNGHYMHNYCEGDKLVNIIPCVRFMQAIVRDKKKDK